MMIAKYSLQLITAVFVAAGLMACDDEPRSCKVADKTYGDGEQWDCADGCNQCSCEDGRVISTDAECTVD